MTRRTSTAAIPGHPLTRRLQASALAVLAAGALSLSAGRSHAQPADPASNLPAAAQPAAPAQLEGPPLPAAPVPATIPTAPAAPVAPAAPPPVTAPVPAAPAASAASAPRYSAAEVAQMFGYIDRNRDGVISREEAAGFRGVARHFDEADTNKDNQLSRDEFVKAMSQVR